MFQSNMKVWMGGVLLVLVLVAGTYTFVAPPQQQRLNTLEGQVNYIGQMQVNLADLQAQIDQLSNSQANKPDMQPRLDQLQSQLNTQQAQLDKLQTQLNSLSTQIQAAQADSAAKAQAVNLAEIATAQYVLDSTGLHIMAANLDAKKEIDPAYAGAVLRLRKVMASTRWPAALADQNKQFLGLLDTLSVALQSNKPDEAVDAVNKAHAAEHAFSKAIDDWMKQQPAQ